MGGVIVEDVVKSAARKAAEDAAKKAAEDAAKDAAKKAAEDAAKKAAEDAAKKAAEDAAKKASEDAAKKASEDAAKKAAEDAAKKSAEDAAKDASKKAAEDAAKKAARTTAVRSAGALTRDFMLNASKVVTNLPLIGPLLSTAGKFVGLGTGGGVLYEIYKHTIGASGPPPKPEGAAEIVGPDGKPQPVRPISKEDAQHRNPADFARNKDGSQAFAPDGRPYVKYDPNDPNETFTSFGFLDNVIKWVADFEKNPTIAPYASLINAGIVALTAGIAGSLLNPALGLILAIGAGALMYFKGNDFIKDRAAEINSHDDWQTKHYFNSSAQGAPQQPSGTPATPRAPINPMPAPG